MQFLTKPDIGDAVAEALSQAVSVRIASAFFSPGSDMLKLLNAAQNLRLVISEEFTVNNPKKIEALKTAAIRSIPTDSDQGKLHAKVFLAEMSDGSDWVLLGSANLTDQGLFFNQEACIALSSAEPADRSTVAQIKAWFRMLWGRSRPIDMEQAKEIWDTHGNQKRTPKIKSKAGAPGYYAIKTTSGGSNKKEHWGVFEAESIVAIGWEDIVGDPSKMTVVELRRAILKAYPNYSERSEKFAYNTFRKFINMPDQSIVMICRGLAPNQEKTPVRVYAFARVIGPFYADQSAPPEWRFKRRVIIQPVEMRLDPQVFSELIRKDSFMQTMHDLDQASIEAVASELGIQVEI
jgi:HKD family nuclease